MALTGTETKADGGTDDAIPIGRCKLATVSLVEGEAERLAAAAERYEALGMAGEAAALREFIDEGVKPALFAGTYVDAQERIVAGLERARALREGRAEPVEARRVRAWWGAGGVRIVSDHERRAVAAVPARAHEIITAALQGIANEVARRGYVDVTEINPANATADTLTLRKRFSELCGTAYRFASSLRALRTGSARSNLSSARENLEALEAMIGRSLDLDLPKLVVGKQLDLFAEAG